MDSHCCDPFVLSMTRELVKVMLCLGLSTSFGTPFLRLCIYIYQVYACGAPYFALFKSSPISPWDVRYMAPTKAVDSLLQLQGVGLQAVPWQAPLPVSLHQADEGRIHTCWRLRYHLWYFQCTHFEYAPSQIHTSGSVDESRDIIQDVRLGGVQPRRAPSCAIGHDMCFHRVYA
jgi:hypothetical protein